MRNSVDPRKGHNRPGDELVEGNVLVELDDTVQRRLAREGYQRSAHRQQDECNVDMQYKCSGSSDRVCEAKHRSRTKKRILSLISYAFEPVGDVCTLRK